MTREKAIEWLRLQRDKKILWDDYSDNTQNIRKEAEKQIKESYEMAIKALGQEPCDDCISRENVIEDVVKCTDMNEDTMEVLEEKINKLPSVIPQQKMGHWIKSRDSYGNNHFTCPFCEHDIATEADTLGDNYCSNCGSKLQESEE